MMKILQNMFSIQDYGETHHLLRLFGLKIKFPKKEFEEKRKENPYYYYKKNNIDITTIPPATGQIRDIQLANLALLKELDYVCKQNNLQYWLDFGTLMGAVRHKGYIPWDDDIDVSMLREDYEKLLEVFPSATRNPDIYAEFEKASTKVSRVAIKIRHKCCPHLFIDVFPDDVYYAQLSEKEQKAKTNELKEVHSKLQKKLQSKDKDSVYKIYKKTITENIPNYKNIENPNILMGMDFYHTREYWIYDNEIFFPLQDMEFEGFNFPAVKEADYYLKKLYGDYMTYPKKIGFGHNIYKTLSEDDKKVIEELKESLNV